MVLRGTLDVILTAFRVHLPARLVAICFVFLACVPTWSVEPMQPQRTLTEGPIRVTKTDKTIVMLRAPVAVGDSLIGIALYDPNRRIAIPLAQVATVEAQRSRSATPGEVARGYLMYVGALMAVGVILVTLK